MAIRATMQAETDDELSGLVNGLALASLAQMRRAPFPPLYSSGIQYQREPLRRERWQLAGDTLAQGAGDCEDLVAYRVAELWKSNIAARGEVRTVHPGLRHVFVRLPDGKIEDPSLRLGMAVDDRYWDWIRKQAA